MLIARAISEISLSNQVLPATPSTTKKDDVTVKGNRLIVELEDNKTLPMRASLGDESLFLMHFPILLRALNEMKQV